MRPGADGRGGAPRRRLAKAPWPAPACRANRAETRRCRKPGLPAAVRTAAAQPRPPTPARLCSDAAHALPDLHLLQSTPLPLVEPHLLLLLLPLMLMSSPAFAGMKPLLMLPRRERQPRQVGPPADRLLLLGVHLLMGSLWEQTLRRAPLSPTAVASEAARRCCSGRRRPRRVRRPKLRAAAPRAAAALLSARWPGSAGRSAAAAAAARTSPSASAPGVDAPALHERSICHIASASHADIWKSNPCGDSATGGGVTEQIGAQTCTATAAGCQAADGGVLTQADMVEAGSRKRPRASEGRKIMPDACTRCVVCGASMMWRLTSGNRP